jgi:hypothetical protein
MSSSSGGGGGILKTCGGGGTLCSCGGGGILRSCGGGGGLMSSVGTVLKSGTFTLNSCRGAIGFLLSAEEAFGFRIEEDSS